jgi:hypothetical protein
LLTSGSAVARLSASQELLTRQITEAGEATINIASDRKLPLYARVAGIYTYAQLTGESGIPAILKLSEDKDLHEFTLRALTDRKAFLKSVPVEPFVKALKDPSPRVQAAAIIGLGRLGRIEAAKALLQTSVPASFAAPAKGTEGLHALPNSGIIPAHLAVRALVSLNAVNECVTAVGTANSTLALWALRYMHDTKAVDGLINAYKQTKNQKLKNQILTTLARLYKEEAPYDGSWWWSTRPDSHGPYYKAITWEASPRIKAFLISERAKTSVSGKQFYADLNARNRMDIATFGGEERVAVVKEAKIDLEKIRNKKGQIGKSSIEDVMLAIAKIKGESFQRKGSFYPTGLHCLPQH